MFNQASSDNAYVGYMYGAIGSSSYNVTHTNTTSSVVKKELEQWYEENLLDYEKYLADSGFCGDRSVASSSGLWNSSDTALGYGTNVTYYGSYNRLVNVEYPQFACPQSNDLYTTSSSTKGNKALDYPIGLLTADEVAYAGGVYNTTNTSYYLNVGFEYWTISPFYFNGSYIYVSYADSDGSLSVGNRGIYSRGIRPVISLNSNVEWSAGDGTSSNPYVVKTN